MKLILWCVIGVLALYLMASLGETMLVLSDPKATVLQQISMRLNNGLAILSIVVCLCTLAVMEVLERGFGLCRLKSENDEAKANGNQMNSAPPEADADSTPAFPAIDRPRSAPKAGGDAMSDAAHQLYGKPEALR